MNFPCYCAFFFICVFSLTSSVPEPPYDIVLMVTAAGREASGGRIRGTTRTRPARLRARSRTWRRCGGPRQWNPPQCRPGPRRARPPLPGVLPRRAYPPPTTAHNPRVDSSLRLNLTICKLVKLLNNVRSLLYFKITITKNA